MTTMTMLLLIVGCMVVTWLPRMLPFLVVRTVTLPPIVLRWLQYIPVCILSALVFETIFQVEERFVTINWLHAVALVPTFVVAIWTKSLSLTVVVGVVTMACLRIII
ncbi:AzlD domain-containing protein [Caryophanon latum]|uniref:Branched-chain amino acid transporter AzlD n=1 Tax=Caryophanon latum TaxID=33977 RepID=A0A1C0YTE3_9BACL|nr:AzlD domain-containing protein [Caryophanon latum]OCS90422.1 branched-chain amino acid transporter AzlD [Caryophanon latum]